MGQRLNLSIQNGDKLLANAYYHWAGYTGSSLALTQKAVEAYEEICNEMVSKFASTPSRKLAVSMLLATDATFYDEEIKRIEEEGDALKKYSHLDYTKVGNDRNAGLISITKDGMEETERYEEFRVTIHLDTQTVDFGVLNEWSEDDYNEYFQDDVDNMTPFLDYALFEDIDPHDIPFDMLDVFAERIDRNYGIRTEVDWLVTPIE